MDELTLVQYAQKGDLDAFNRLVLTYQDMAFNVAMRLLADEDNAQDAVQTAFISAYRHLSGFRGGSFKAWVMRMVTNASYDELRRRQRRPTTPLEPLTDDDDEIESPSWLADEAASPEEALEKAELDRAVQACLQRLEEDFRAVVVIVDLQGLDYLEASAVLGAPLGTIKSRVARARLKLRDCLHKFWDTPLSNSPSGSPNDAGRELFPAPIRLDEEREP
jgi:RNA polymerase sigma-70 factor, ECF subfamily